MEFSPNSPIIFILVGIIISIVLAQSVFFLVKAYKRGIQLGLSKAVLNATIKRSLLFTIAPAVAIFMGVVSLVNMLGVALPWLRLSVIGAVTYELPAAASALESMGLGNVSWTDLTAEQFVTIAFVMTFGIASSLILAPITCKKITGGMLKIKDKDKKWMDLFMTSMFVGMLAAFLGYIVYNIGFVFADSPRKVSYGQAKELSSLLSDDIVPVGVFVNEHMKLIVDLFKDGIIEMAQLHGDEDEKYIRNLKDKSIEETGKQIPVINAIEIKEGADYNDELLKWRDSASDYFILDSGKGSGKTFDWSKKCYCRT